MWLLCVSDFHKRVGMLPNDLILEYAEEGKKEANAKVHIEIDIDTVLVFLLLTLNISHTFF